MTITITKADKENAGGYQDMYKCLLATALKRLLKTKKKIEVGGATVTIGAKDYVLKDGGKIYRSYFQDARFPFKVELSLTH